MQVHRPKQEESRVSYRNRRNGAATKKALNAWDPSAGMAKKPLILLTTLSVVLFAAHGILNARSKAPMEPVAAVADLETTQVRVAAVRTPDFQETVRDALQQEEFANVLAREADAVKNDAAVLVPPPAPLDAALEQPEPAPEPVVTRAPEPEPVMEMAPKPKKAIVLASAAPVKPAPPSIPEPSPLMIAQSLHDQAIRAIRSVAEEVPAIPGGKGRIGTVRRGDTLISVMKRLGTSSKEAIAAAKASKRVFDLASRLTAGHSLQVVIDKKKKLVSLAYDIDKKKTLTLVRSTRGGLSARIEKQAFQDVADALQPGTVKIVKSAQSAPRKTTPADIARNRFKNAPKAVKAVVKRGDNLVKLLGRHKVSQRVAMQAARDAKSVYPLARRLKKGKALRLAFDADGALTDLSYPIDTGRVFWLAKNDKGRFVPTIEKKQFDVRLKIVTGMVNDSLFTAGIKAGLTHSLIVKLARLFEWDVDFARDIRAGDSFRVAFEELHYEGEFARYGDIVAAEFINQGDKFHAMRYTDPLGRLGYFDKDGRNIQKMFIRAPVDFTRVSSRFSRKRRHPVYGFTRAHKGVDYAAPTGTPIRAAGDGRITHRARKGGFGKLVIVKHNSKYATAYAHMRRYAKNLRLGSRVKQGQVIGYVGKTGTATGPHLHYEIRVYGRAKNPLTIQLPSAESIPKRYMADYKARTKPLLAFLEMGPTRVASLSPISRNR